MSLRIHQRIILPDDGLRFNNHYAEPFPVEHDRLHCANDVYHLNGTFESVKVFCANLLAVSYNPAAASPQRYLALLIYTGMRREVVLGLRWEDVDVEKGLLQWLTREEDNAEYVMQDNVTSSTMKRTWERIKSEINVYGATPHCFRHTFTTVCRRSGMDEKTMQVIGGWSDIATMRNVYTHVQQTDLQRAGQLMGGMFQTSRVGF